VIPTVHVVPAAILTPHVVVARLKGPLNEVLEKLRAMLRRFVTVTVFVELVVPAVTVPKLNELDEKVTGAVPVPERLTVCGLLPASSVNASVPTAEPTAVGENVTPTVHFAPAASVAPHVLLAIANGPLIAVPARLSTTFC
jgi:hypothetical protein